MARLVLLIVLPLFCQTAFAGVSDWYRLVQDGDLEAVEDSLLRVTTAATRDGDALFISGLIEPDADQAAELFEASLNSGVTVRFHEEILVRLAEYYALSRRFDRLERVTADYLNRFEKGKYQSRIMRLAVLIDEEQERNEEALRQTDRYLTRFSRGEEQQWGQIDKARLLARQDKAIGAASMLDKLSRANDGPGVPQALTLIVQQMVTTGESDEAVLKYNLLREEYPNAIGLAGLEEKLAALPAPTSPSRRQTSADESQTPVSEGRYFLQVGVFSDAANARNRADAIRKLGIPAELEPRTIHGKPYHVVVAGAFPTAAKADSARARLQRQFGETYRLISR